MNRIEKLYNNADRIRYDADALYNMVNFLIGEIEDLYNRLEN